MKKLIATTLALLVILSVLTACGKTEAIEPVDNIPLEDMLFLFSDMTDLSLGNYVRSELQEENVGNFIGNQDFKASFDEAMTLTPDFNITPFALGVFRLKDGTNASEFANSLQTNAALNKWVCVSAETKRAVHCGKTVVFFMCDRETADVLEDTFDKICEPSFNPKEHIRNPLSGLSVSDFYDKLYQIHGAENYGIMDGAELKTTADDMPQGFKFPQNVEISELVWDIGTTEGDEWDPARSYFIAIVQAEQGVNDKMARKTAESLYDAMGAMSLPLGEAPLSCVGYSAEHGIYFMFTGTGSWAYYTYNFCMEMQNIYRMDIIEAEME